MNNPIRIVIFIGLVGCNILIAMIHFQFTKAINQQKIAIASLERRVSEIESRQHQSIESWEKIVTENTQFNDLLIGKVKLADDILDKKINRLSDTDKIVVEQLKNISKAQAEVVDIITGLSTNSLDK